MRNATVILQEDPARAEKLGSKVKAVSEIVFIVQSVSELQAMALRFRIQFGVLDMGLVTFQDITRLRRELGMEIVCTHRTADEVMWIEALDAGALDCCFDDDGSAICRAIQQTSTACNSSAPRQT